MEGGWKVFGFGEEIGIGPRSSKGDLIPALGLTFDASEAVGLDNYSITPEKPSFPPLSSFSLI